MRMSALFGVKHNFSKFIVSARTGERGGRDFADKWGEGTIFRDFVWTSFMDGP